MILARLLVGARAATRRIVSDWTVVAAAFAAIALAATLLSAGPIYSEAVTIGAFARGMELAPPTESGISIRAGVFPEDVEALDVMVDQAVDAAMGPTDAVTTAIFRIDGRSFARPGAEPFRGATWHVDRIDELATLVEGRWPELDETDALVVPAAVAGTLELALGDVLEVSRAGVQEGTAEVIGIYAVNDPLEPVWFGDPIVADGRTTSGGNQIWGPFLVGQGALLSALDRSRVDVRWRVTPDFSDMRPGEVDALRSGILRLPDDLDARLVVAEGMTGAGITNFDVSTRLPDQLQTIARSLTVTSSTVLAVLLQLSLLAGYALILTARLVVDSRSSETALARSRGSSPTQLSVTAAVEALLLTVPAVVAGPRLAAAVLRILNLTGPTESIGLTLNPRPNTASYLLAGVAGLIALVSLVVPAFRAARAFPDPERRARRQSARSVSQRLGIDLALVLLLVVAVWQLRELGPQVTATVRGRFGVDPLLIAAPLLGLGAGVVLALRLVPLIARFAELVVASRAPAVPVLASWQVARRPARYARSALLLIMAVALGVFASAFSASWLGSQTDQAAHRVGADIRFEASTAEDTHSSLHFESALERLAGVTRAMPLSSTRAPVAPGTAGRAILLDPDAAIEVVSLRPDLADLAPLREMAAGRLELPSLPLEGEPTALVMTWETEQLGGGRAPCGEPGGYCLSSLVSIVLSDGKGQLHRLQARSLASDRVTTMEVDLHASDGTPPTYPLSIVAIEAETMPVFSLAEEPPTSPRYRVDLRVLEVIGSDGASRAVDLDPDDWEISVDSVFFYEPPSIRRIEAPGISMELTVGVGAPRSSFTLGILPAAGAQPARARLPIVVTRNMIDDSFLEIGSVVDMTRLQLGNFTGEVIGAIDAFPGFDSNPPYMVLIDFASVQALQYRVGDTLLRPDGYWLAAPDAPEDIDVTLTSPPFRARAFVATSREVASLTADPVAIGTVGAFAIGFVAAAVFAAIGFAISAVISARERLVEFSLLQAIGLSPRQLRSWLLLEQAVLILLGLAMGTLVGWGLGRLVLPLVTLTQDGSPPVPDLITVYPWGTIAIFELVMLGVLLLVVTVLTAFVRRSGPQEALRFGEETT